LTGIIHYLLQRWNRKKEKRKPYLQQKRFMELGEKASEWYERQLLHLGVMPSGRKNWDLLCTEGGSACNALNGRAQGQI